MPDQFEPRRVAPGEEFEYAEPETGKLRRFRADEDGVVRPSSTFEVAILDGRAAPVARKAMADEKES